MQRAAGPFQRYRHRVLPLIEERLRALIQEEELSDLYRYVVQGGKRVRPTLTLLISDSLNGDLPMALDLACSVELTHCASLALDDILDGHQERRGRPTLFWRRGLRHAVTTGFTLPSLAIHLASRYGQTFAEALSDSWVSMCLGAYQEGRPEETTWGSYRHLVELKTAKLFATACLFGAGAAKQEGRAFQEFGLHLGRAFQMADDLADGFDGDGRLGVQELRKEMERETETAERLTHGWNLRRLDLLEALRDAPSTVVPLKVGEVESS